MLSRGSVSASQSGLFAVNSLVVEVRHPELAALLVFVDQPHAAGVALALLDQRLREAAKEPVDVGLAHEEIERELNGVGLNVGQALARGSAARSLAPAPPAGSPRSGDVETVGSAAVISCAGSHSLNYPSRSAARCGIVQRSQIAPRPNGRAGGSRASGSRAVRPLPDCSARPATGDSSEGHAHRSHASFIPHASPSSTLVSGCAQSGGAAGSPSTTARHRRSGDRSRDHRVG